MTDSMRFVGHMNHYLLMKGRIPGTNRVCVTMWDKVLLLVGRGLIIFGSVVQFPVTSIILRDLAQ